MSSIISIMSLEPTISPSVHQSIKAVVTLCWPYSSSTKQCALLLSDPDFRLRHRKGQVRVRFTGPSAEAVARSKIGIGDELLLKLSGASWLSHDVEATVSTPGKSVDGELVYKNVLGLKILSQDGQPSEDRNVDVNVGEQESENGQEIEEAVGTPAPTGKLAHLRRSMNGSIDFSAVPIYSSPAFIRRARLSSEGFLDGAYDPFDYVNLDMDHLPRKKQKTSWRYLARSPSPSQKTTVGDTIHDLPEREKSMESPIFSLRKNEDSAPIRNLLEAELVAGESQAPGKERNAVEGSTYNTEDKIARAQLLPFTSPSVQVDADHETSQEKTPERSSAKVMYPAQAVVDASPISSSEAAANVRIPSTNPEMLSPSLPQSQVLRQPSESETLGSQVWNANAKDGPSTPKLQPVSSSALPLPSPFPVEPSVLRSIARDKVLDGPATQMLTADQHDTMQTRRSEKAASHSAPFESLDETLAKGKLLPVEPGIRTQKEASLDDLASNHSDQNLPESDSLVEIPRLEEMSDTEEEEDMYAGQLIDTNSDKGSVEAEMIYYDDADEVIDADALSGDAPSDEDEIAGDDEISDDEEEMNSQLQEDNARGRAQEEADASLQSHELSVIHKSSLPTKSHKERFGENAEHREYDHDPATPVRAPVGFFQFDGNSSSPVSQSLSAKSDEKQKIMSKTFQSLFGFTSTRTPGLPLAEQKADTETADTDGTTIDELEESHAKTRKAMDDVAPSFRPVRQDQIADGSQTLAQDESLVAQPSDAVLDETPDALQTLAESHTMHISPIPEIEAIGTTTDITTQDKAQPQERPSSQSATEAVMISSGDDEETQGSRETGDDHSYEHDQQPGTVVEMNGSDIRPVEAELLQSQTGETATNSTESNHEAAKAQSLMQRDPDDFVSSAPQDVLIKAISDGEVHGPGGRQQASQQLPTLEQEQARQQQQTHEPYPNTLDTIDYGASNAPAFVALGSTEETHIVSNKGVPTSPPLSSTAVVDVSLSSPAEQYADEMLEHQASEVLSTTRALEESSADELSPDNHESIEKHTALAAQRNDISKGFETAVLPPDDDNLNLLYPTPIPDIELASTKTPQQLYPPILPSPTALQSQPEDTLCTSIKILQQPLTPAFTQIGSSEVTADQAKEGALHDQVNSRTTIIHDESDRPGMSKSHIVPNQSALAIQRSDDYLPAHTPVRRSKRSSQTKTPTTEDQSDVEDTIAVVSPHKRTPARKSTRKKTNSVEVISTDMQNVKEQQTHRSENQQMAKKSAASRLTNVPDVISAWFSPRHSSRLQSEGNPVVKYQDVASQGTTEVTNKTPLKGKTHTRATSNGVATRYSYFTSLSTLDEKLNPSSQPGIKNLVDIIAIVEDNSTVPKKAKAGPKDHFTILYITDPSLGDGSRSVMVEVFRHWRAQLPIAHAGDAILLRDFTVKSHDHRPHLLSTDTSAWCVWKYAQETVGQEQEPSKPIRIHRTRAGSFSETREEVKGPPVELGDEERVRAEELHGWWQGLEASKRES